MLCQECQKREANIHIIKKVNGKQTELNLCEGCARKREELDFSFEPQFSLHKLFAGILGQGLINSREAMAAPRLQCPGCGLSFAQFSQIGRLGCRDCFTAFAEKLRPLFRRIHGSTVHSGKVPIKLEEKVLCLREIGKLRHDLQAKIEAEEFEAAALLRDQIRALESKVQDDVAAKGEDQ